MEELFQRRILQPERKYLAELADPPIFVPAIKEHVFRLAKDSQSLWKITQDTLSPTAALEGGLSNWFVLRCNRDSRIAGYNLLPYDFLTNYDDALLLTVLSSDGKSSTSTLSVVSLKHFYPMPHTAVEAARSNDVARMYSLYAAFSSFYASVS